MVLMALGEKFVERKLDLFQGEHKKEDYLKINPAGKVPAVRVGKFTMSESRAIACYLCNKFNSAKSKKLYPRGAEARAEVDRLLLLSDDVNAAIQKQINLPGVLFGGGRPNEEAYPEVVKAVKMVADILGDCDYVAGNNLTIADFFVVTPFLLFGSTQEEEMLNKLKKEEGGDKVGAWMQRLKKLPYFEAVNKEGLAKIGGLYKSKV